MNKHFRREMTCVHRIHRSLSYAEADAGTKGVVSGVTIGVRRVRADWSRSNYSAKANC